MHDITEVYVVALWMCAYHQTGLSCSTILFLQLAEEHGVKFMETSAKSGVNVEAVSENLHGRQPCGLQSPSF